MEDDGQSSIVLKKYHKLHICLWQPAEGGEALIYLFVIKVTKIKMSILAWKQQQSFTAKLDETCLTLNQIWLYKGPDDLCPAP